jgi:phosphopantothenoylcysteine synthetase/decarboxylase
MRYLLITAVLAAFLLSACGDPKPAQYPPSLYKDHENLLSDEELADVQRESAASEVAEDIFPAEDHSIDDEMERAKEVEESQSIFPAEDDSIGNDDDDDDEDDDDDDDDDDE